MVLKADGDGDKELGPKGGEGRRSVYMNRGR